MRLDKLFSTVGLLSRSETAAACRRGSITVNGEVARRADLRVDEEHDEICYLGEPVVFRRFVYLFLNKPAGYVSATEDSRLPVVTELAPPEYRRLSLFPCGRLDRDTTGLMLLTNDGALSHALLSPRRAVEKVYAFTTDAPLPEDAEERLLAGMRLGEEVCRPARLAADEGRCSGRVTLTEGKYHEVKRMMAALGARIVTLERISFAGIPLPPDLPRGACRPLTKSELAVLFAAARQPRKESPHGHH